MAMRLLTLLAFLLLVAWLPISLVSAKNDQSAVAAAASAARPWLLLVLPLVSVGSGRLVKMVGGLCLAAMVTLSTMDLGLVRTGLMILLSWLLLFNLSWFNHARPSDNPGGDRHVR